MVTDIALSQDKDIHLDDGNDLALVSGQQQLQQSVAIDVFDELQDFVAGRITGQEVGLLEERIRVGLNEDPQVGEIVRVNVTEYNQTSSTIDVEVQVADNEDFELTI
jgi:hypothetical protein